LSIIEETDATAAEKRICEINSGIYVISFDFLRKNIKKLGTGNRQGEYYLPDLVLLARSAGLDAKALTHVDPTEVMGINNRVELASAGKVMRERVLKRLMLSGVTIIDPAAVYVDDSVEIGRDAVIHPGAHISGDTIIGEGAVIEDNAAISNSLIGANVRIRRHTTIESSTVGVGAIVGPYARLRPGTVLHDDAHVGNFVEIKNSRIGKGSKANHLAYIGDSDVGAGVNIGAGAITCNYDGVKKFRTVIKDNVFIGSDSQLIAPVTVGKGAYVGSGSTITKDVPDGALALSRVEQKNIPGWVEKRFGKGQKRK
jgi:bifunctional UDP-N-acetylglucosamine pyrophosphorylase/glucosamine-1-phosphate N-acetyltransferase